MEVAEGKEETGLLDIVRLQDYVHGHCLFQICRSTEKMGRTCLWQRYTFY